MSHARLSYTFKNYRPKKLDKLLSLRKNSECSGADSVLTRSGFGNNAKFDGLMVLRLRVNPGHLDTPFNELRNSTVKHLAVWMPRPARNSRNLEALCEGSNENPCMHCSF